MSEPEKTKPKEDADSWIEKYIAENPPPPFVPRRKARRKALRIEVSPRTFEAVKANPGDLKLIAKDRHGNAVVERPHRPRTGTISESEVGLRIRAESIGRPRLVEPGAGRLPALPYGSAPDQRWVESKTWTGETRYVRDDGSRNPNVTHVYDVFDVLRED
jgi:hypothetical protein